ncbi:GntR family transcriptional regulator [Actinoplanes sp. NBC_00393]|uniref:GntR family transcriptional regulator n=1 Tax=Actinoplanes sp. NBC_00393 TaxID=2975953 RepID=UPI002E1D4834
MTAAGGPAYRRVADALREGIRNGELAPGSRLASLPKLGQEFDVSPDVARQALAVLRAEGLVETRQGAGAFVRAFAQITRRAPDRLARERWVGGEAIQDADTGPRWRTVDITVNEIPAPAAVAVALDLSEGEPVVARSRRFLVDERPVQLATSYFPADLVRGTAIAYTDTGPGGSYARLAELGHEPVRFRERVEDRLPDSAERSTLALPADGSRIFEVTRLAFTADGRCVEVNRMVLDAAVYVLEYEFSA